jgi:hypothetical protein
MKNFSIFGIAFFAAVCCSNQIAAQITLSGQSTWVDPGETYQYTPGGASACPNDYSVSTVAGTNTANNTGSGTGAGPFTYRWNNSSSGNFSLVASNYGASCSSITPKTLVISHIYLSDLGSISTPGGVVSCGTTPVTITVGSPTTSPSFDVANSSQNVQLLYTWSIPEWGVSNVQTRMGS